MRMPKHAGPASARPTNLAARCHWAAEDRSMQAGSCQAHGCGCPCHWTAENVAATKFAGHSQRWPVGQGHEPSHTHVVVDASPDGVF